VQALHGRNNVRVFYKIINNKMIKIAYTLKDIEKIGELGQYEHQADEFLRLTNSKLEVKYLRTGLYFNETDKNQTRDIYEFTLSRGERSYTSTFGASLNDTWTRYSKHVRQDDKRNNAEQTFKAYYIQERPTFSFLGIGNATRSWTAENKTMAQYGYHSEKPSAYSILAGMQSYAVGTFDDFISEYGYEIDSKKSYEDAHTTYAAIVEQYNKLCSLYNDKELQAMSSIQ
jgi:hypothetical protein